MPRAQTKPSSLQTALQIVQIATLLGGIASVFLVIGRRDAEFSGLQRRVEEDRKSIDQETADIRDVLRDIAKAQTSFLVVDATHTVEIGVIRSQMVDLRAQLEKMQGSK